MSLTAKNIEYLDLCERGKYPITGSRMGGATLRMATRLDDWGYLKRRELTSKGLIALADHFAARDPERSAELREKGLHAKAVEEAKIENQNKAAELRRFERAEMREQNRVQRIESFRAIERPALDADDEAIEAYIEQILALGHND